MMFSRFFLALVCPLALTRANPPQNAEDQTTPSPKDSLLPTNTSTDGTDVPLNASNGLRIECDGEKYGFSPKVADCQNAREYYTRSSKLNTYGQRHSGYGADVFPLPFRTMGDEALCYLEPVLIDSSSTGVTSINYLSDAAYELILQCAIRESKGGIATNIGTLYASKIGAPRSSGQELRIERKLQYLRSSGGENMALVLGTYQPDIQCGKPLDTWKSCRSIIGDMPTLSRSEIFGPQDDAAVQILLPQFVASADQKCVLRIFGKGGRDVTSWYKVWEAVSAVYAVCLRHEKVATFRGLGELGNIFFTMTAPTPKLGSLSTTTVSSNDTLF